MTQTFGTAPIMCEKYYKTIMNREMGNVYLIYSKNKNFTG